MNTHENLKVWKESIDFVKDIYEMTRGFPDSERYGLISQLRRAAVSVPTNIAEGAARRSRKEYLQFLHVSRGSLSEIDTLLCISERLNLLDKPAFQVQHSKAQTLGKMLTGLIKALKANSE